jgi:dienelactone hydrolase
VILFHHARGLTDGVQAFAEQLRSAGHHVTVPDLYDGKVFDTLEAGVAHAQEVIGFEQVIAAGVAAAAQVPAASVYAGFSLGVLPAQELAQTRPGALGALLLHSGAPSSTFSAGWPAGVALQAHVAQDDPWGDVDDVRALVQEAGGELFLYPGSAHLFTDSSLDEYDPALAAQVLERTLGFLGRW